MVSSLWVRYLSVGPHNGVKHLCYTPDLFVWDVQACVDSSIGPIKNKRSLLLKPFWGMSYGQRVLELCLFHVIGNLMAN